MNSSIDISNFTISLLLIVLVWFLLTMSFFSWGKLAAKLLGIKINGKSGIIAKIWLGFTFCLFIFSIYHLFFPINALASSMIYISGLIYFLVYYAKKLPQFIKAIGWQKVFIIFLTLFCASAIAIQFPKHLDTGLYHLNSIRWANEYHIIKGLGNLHDRLGFNQLFFLYSASLNFHPYLNDYAFHLSNSFIYALFSVGLLLNGTVIDLILLCLFFFIPMPIYWLSCPTPDIASTLIQIVAFRYFLEVIYYNPKGKERSSIIAFVAILSALTITLKLSNVFFALGLGILTIIISKKYSFESCENKLILKSFIFIGLLFTIWIVRGYIQTGYPFFPSSLGKLSFIWTVPEKIAKGQKDYIYTSACNVETNDLNSPTLKNYSWVNNWFKINFYDSSILADNDSEKIYIIVLLLLFPFILEHYGLGTISLCILTIINIIIWAISVCRSKNLFYKSDILIYSILFNIIYLVFWFFMAPDPRFINGIIIIIFITSLLLLKIFFPQKLTVDRKVKTILMIYPIIMFIWYFNSQYSMDYFTLNGISVLTKAPMKELTTDSGLKVLLPATGKDYNIWDSELPASPYFSKNLSLIGDNISDGFYLKKD